MGWSDFLNFERTNKELRWLAMNKPPSQSDDDADRNSCEAALEHLNTWLGYPNRLNSPKKLWPKFYLNKQTWLFQKLNFSKNLTNDKDQNCVQNLKNTIKAGGSTATKMWTG